MKYLINNNECRFSNVVSHYRNTIVTTIPIYNNCQHIYQRGESRGSLCLEPAIAGMKYCKTCFYKTSRKERIDALNDYQIMFDTNRNEFYKRVLYHYILFNFPSK